MAEQAGFGCIIRPYLGTDAFSRNETHPVRGQNHKLRGNWGPFGPITLCLAQNMVNYHGAQACNYVIVFENAGCARRVIVFFVPGCFFVFFF